MNFQEDIALGYIKELKLQKQYKFYPEYFPSKIGGLPVYLNP